MNKPFDLLDPARAPRGVATLVKTPFLDDGRLDETSYRRQVRHVIRARTVMLIPGMGGAETFSLSQAEHVRCIEICLEEAQEKIPVCATVCGMDIAEIVRRGREAADMGVDMVSQVVPTWMRRETDAAEAITAVAKAVNIPILFHSLFGIPPNILGTETLARLVRELDNARYVKIEGAQYVRQVVALRAAAGALLCGLMSGPSLAAMCHRAGCSLIMTAADLIELRVAAFDALERGDTEEARKIEAIDKSISFIKTYVPGEAVNKIILEWRGLFDSRRPGKPQFPGTVTELNADEERELADSLRPALPYFTHAPPRLP